MHLNLFQCILPVIAYNKIALILVTSLLLRIVAATGAADDEASLSIFQCATVILTCVVDQC